ncbi:hypothetical protein [Streptomyces iconiensis]|uniref:Uncharacterized protein n=1 Tax=Streptomyces iconiensis TaxID=1384038 RepID=A0ABT6ZTQ7_9ACTN|nr:hypothetical protein [Streptomyces iconiensis]MDJ1132450.1 hypothetical protein [Streptomyces iconiensis]
MTADQIEGVATLSALPALALLAYLIERARLALRPGAGTHRALYATAPEEVPEGWQPTEWRDCINPACGCLHAPHFAHLDGTHTCAECHHTSGGRDA